MSELQKALETVNVKLPAFEVRQLMEKYGQRDRLTFQEFSKVICFV
jgi:hypothetical protein